MVRAIGFCPDLPIIIVLSICSVSCLLLMEKVHTTGSCCDIPIQIVIVSVICFWSCLLVGMVRSIALCPDLKFIVVLSFIIDICPDLPQKSWPQFRSIDSTRNQLCRVAEIPIDRQHPKSIVAEIAIDRQHPKSLAAAIPINRQHPKSIVAAIPIDKTPPEIIFSRAFNQ